VHVSFEMILVNAYESIKTKNDLDS